MPDNFRHDACGFYSKLSGELCKKFYERAIELQIKNDEMERIIISLNFLAVKHVKTAEHSMRVGLLCESIAKELGLSRKALFYDGWIHDIGKALVPNSVLDKKEGFNDEDMEIVKKHTVYAVRLLGGVFPFSTRSGGSGHHLHQANPYPPCRPGWDDIPFSNRTKELMDYYSQFVAIADKIDSNISRDNEKTKENKIATIDDAVKATIKEMPDKKEIIERLQNAGIFKEHIKLVPENRLEICL